jgi:ankyrin repeat protein
MSASLAEAAAAGNLREVCMRLDLGEDVNQKLFPRFTTALHDAIVCGRVEVAKELIER